MGGADGGSARPTFSIVTAAYNSQATLGDTVVSVLAQTLGDFEHLIVDDGSTDGTLELARSFAEADPRIRVLTRPNGGTGAARNTGLEAARGDWLVLLDADDMMLPCYLERQARFIGENPGFDIYSCNGIYLMPGGSRLTIWRGPAYARVRRYTLEDILRRNRIFIMATVRAESVRAVGGFGSMRRAEDIDLWLRMLASGARHVYNPAKLGEYRIVSGSSSTDEVGIAESVLASVSGLHDREDLDDRRRAAVEAAVVRGRKRVEIAGLRKRLAGGDATRARRTYLANAAGLASPWQRWLGSVLMLVHPSAYKLVFMRRR